MFTWKLLLFDESLFDELLFKFSFDIYWIYSFDYYSFNYYRIWGTMILFKGSFCTFSSGLRLLKTWFIISGYSNSMTLPYFSSSYLFISWLLFIIASFGIREEFFFLTVIITFSSYFSSWNLKAGFFRFSYFLTSSWTTYGYYNIYRPIWL